jgi:hypothetical protein
MATYTVSIGEFIALSADPVLQWGAGCAVTANVSLTSIVGGPVWSLAIAERATANSVQSVRITAGGAIAETISLADAPINRSNLNESITSLDVPRTTVIFTAQISESITATDVVKHVIPVDIFEGVNARDTVEYYSSVIAGAENVYRKISPKIDAQFPEFIREDGPQFVAFLKGYYQFAEQNGMPINAIRGLQDNQDVDRSLDKFVEYFRREFMPNIPRYIAADKRLMTKYIRDFYRSRGADDSFRAIFRAMFNKEIDLYYPGNDILRASDGRWVKETIIRVGAPFNASPFIMAGSIITGMTSGASARVENIQGVEASGILVYDFTIQGLSGNFLDGEMVEDEFGNTATINNQLGSLVGIGVTQGGAYHSAGSGGSYHNKGDIVEITGAASTEPAYGQVTAVSNKSAVEVVLLDGGTGYTKNNTVLTISDGDGTGLAVRIASWTPTLVSTPVNSDQVGPMDGVMIGAPGYFVSMGSNNATVSSKLSGKLIFSTTSNTIYGIGTAFESQLQPDLLVRVVGQANTLRVHSVLSDGTFVSAFRPQSNQISPGADAYIRLAAANAYSTLQSAFAFSTIGTYSVNSIAIINPGYGYTKLPTITITDPSTSLLNVDDGFGGKIGQNAVVGVDNAPGAITSIALTTPGANFNKNELATIRNVTQGNSVIVQSTPGNRGSTWRSLKSTYNAYGTPQVSGITFLPGRYTDTKGFLSWNNKLQDNYYYQEFSYVVRVTELLVKYQDIIKNLVHPAGTKMFGTYNMRSSATMPFTYVEASSNIQNVQNSEAIEATDIVVGGIISSAARVETISPAEIMTSYVSKDVDIPNAANANGVPVAIATYPAARTEAANANGVPNATGTYPGSSTANTAVTDTSVAIAAYAAARTEAATATDTPVAIATYPGAGTANVTSTEAASAEKFLLASGTYVTVQYANDVVSVYESISAGTYDTFPIGGFDGNPRLVRIAKGTPWFANNTLRANTGSIQVGGSGTKVIVASVGSGSTTTYQVNAIFSNTFLSLRTNYLPVTSNATFAYSVG